MRTFRFDKLVRDKIVSTMTADGCRVDWRGLKDEEYYAHLLEKPTEEIKELKKTPTIEEAADVKEVSLAFEAQFGLYSSEYHDAMLMYGQFLAEHPQLYAEQIEKARNEKFQKLGGFYNRMFVVTVSAPETSSWLSYYESNYTEIL